MERQTKAQKELVKKYRSLSRRLAHTNEEKSDYYESFTDWLESIDDFPEPTDEYTLEDIESDLSEEYNEMNDAEWMFDCDSQEEYEEAYGDLIG